MYFGFNITFSWCIIITELRKRGGQKVSKDFKISLKAARVNANLTQEEVAKRMAEYMGESISRARIASFEDHPEKTPLAWAEGFSKIYHISVKDISFLPISKRNVRLGKVTN